MLVNDSMNQGIGLRTGHYARILEEGLSVPWVEAITENFLGRGGRPLAVLERVRRDAQVLLHGVSLSLGGVDALNEAYLGELRSLARHIEAAAVSDHLCFGSVGGHYAHDLWPLPYTEEALENLSTRVQQVQDFLGRPLLVENVSSYVEWQASTLSEWELLSELVRRTGCKLLLDINNVYVSASNHGFSARTFLEGLPREAVGQYHLAGHEDRGTFLLDSHEAPVPEPVLALYREALERFGLHPTIVEWDGQVPPLETVLAESERARAVAEDFLRGRAA